MELQTTPRLGGPPKECVKSPRSSYIKSKNTIDLVFTDLCYTVKVKNRNRKNKNDPKFDNREILHNLNGICKHGEVLAIMGSSGAGKTSLLNLLSCRIAPSKNVEITGDMTVNKQPYNQKTFSKFAGYVMQFDVLMQTLTPRESFEFAANLRVKATKQEKLELVNGIIADLSLDRAADTLIGGPLIKGVSGGERKRASIGVELITDPSILFLDEPTSGLDSFTAYIIIKLLKQYANAGKTIIFTIHQPSSDIFNLFDRYMILAKGKFIYQGHAKDTVDYFSKQGYKCPDFVNPADYLMELAHSDGTETTKFMRLWKTYDDKINPNILYEIRDSETSPITYISKTNSWFYEVEQLASRAYKNFRRNPILFKGRIVQLIFIAFFACSIYFRVTTDPKDPQAITNRNGILFFMGMSIFMMNMMGIILTFPQERDVFLREIGSNMYGVSSYFVGRTSTELPFVTIVPFAWCAAIYWIIHFNNDNPGKFFIFAALLVIQALAGNALGLLGGSVFSEPKVALAVIPLLLMPLIMFSGLFLNTHDMPVWIGWLQWLSPFRYTLEGLTTNEYTDSPLGQTGLDALVSLGFHLGIWKVAVINLFLGLAWRMVALLSLKMLVRNLQ